MIGSWHDCRLARSTDIMAGVEAVVKSNPWVDQNRLGVTGGSYGGYLTNWIVGHTDRFHAAVTLRGITDFISNDGTRDLAYGHESDFRGFLFDEFDQHWSASPLKYAKNVKTPMLVLHADNDYRVPLGQAEEWFRALKHYGNRVLSLRDSGSTVDTTFLARTISRTTIYRSQFIRLLLQLSFLDRHLTLWIFAAMATVAFLEPQ